MREYESCFALLIRDFIAYRKASGRWNEASYGPNLRVFDRFCAMNYPDSVHLTQEMVDRWCRQRDSETNNSCRSRIYVVYSFIKYLSERGLSEVLPPRIPRKERVTYILMPSLGMRYAVFSKPVIICRTSQKQETYSSGASRFRYSSGFFTAAAYVLLKQGCWNVRMWMWETGYSTSDIPKATTSITLPCMTAWQT